MPICICFVTGKQHVSEVYYERIQYIKQITERFFCVPFSNKQDRGGVTIIADQGFTKSDNIKNGFH